MFSDIYVLVGHAMPPVHYVKEIEESELTETLVTLPANLFVARIELKKPNGDIHHAQEERIQRRPGKPNMYAYTIPYMDCQIHTFIHNMGSTAVSLLQTCLPTHGACLPVLLAPPGGEVKLPLTRNVPGDECTGFDILDPETKRPLLELRFLYARIPALVSTESDVRDLKRWRNGKDYSKHDPDSVPKQEPVDDDRYDHSPHENPKRRPWFSWGTKPTSNADPSKTNTRCDVIAENALEDTEHTAVLAQMRAMLA